MSNKIILTFPDGRSGEYSRGISCKEIAEGISISLAKKSIACSLNNKLYDLSTKIEEDAEIAFITSGSEDERSLDIIRHDTAHLLAQAVKEIFGDKVQITIGPAIENGFYYDFATSHSFTTEDLPIIEKKMQEIASRNYLFEREIWARDKAIEFFNSIGEEFKAKIIKDLPGDEEISVYKQGDFYDLCRGPHAYSMGYLKHFKLLRVSASYWKGDSKNQSLQRIYGTAWGTKKSLDDYINRLEEAKKRDHRKIGKEMDLFHQQNEAVGDIFWHPNGWKMYSIITDYIKRAFQQNEYQEVKTPIIVKRELWEKSGHWDKFKQNMFVAEIDEEDYAIKPMNCPCHVQIFNNDLRSYKDLPIRLAEFGCCHRYEPSGSLYGIMRTRSFVQDDAHIFCTPDQITSEVVSFCSMLKKVYTDFGFTEFKVKFSDRPALRAGTDETWDMAESALTTAVKEVGYEYTLNPGEGAFYGPKLEFVLKDAIGRDWQCGTLQVDFILPERLSASYIDSDGTKKIPVMLHRAILGSVERFIGILIEQYAGKFPLWLSPVQAVVFGVSDNFSDYAKLVAQKLNKADIRAFCDLDSNTVGYKIRQHSMKKVPVIIVVGENEVKNNTVSVRFIGSSETSTMSTDDLIGKLSLIIKNKENI